MLQILDAMHRKSIPSFGVPIHFAYSDVKPQNICFSADWRPVLIDVDALKFQDNVYAPFLALSLCFCLVSVYFGFEPLIAAFDRTKSIGTLAWSSVRKLRGDRRVAHRVFRTTFVCSD